MKRLIPTSVTLEEHHIKYLEDQNTNKSETIRAILEKLINEKGFESAKDKEESEYDRIKRLSHYRRLGECLAKVRPYYVDMKKEKLDKIDFNPIFHKYVKKYMLRPKDVLRQLNKEISLFELWAEKRNEEEKEMVELDKLNQ